MNMIAIQFMVRGKRGTIYNYSGGGKPVSTGPGNQMCDHASYGVFSHSLTYVFMSMNMQLNKVR